MKVSFDYDDTLNTDVMKKVAQRHIHFGDEVHITTTRDKEFQWVGHNPNHNEDLYQLAEKLGIKEEFIHFTGHENKIHHLNGFDIHYDDCEFEIDLITRSDLKCLGILINYKNYALGL
jgi:hypothetical protein